MQSETKLKPCPFCGGRAEVQASLLFKGCYKVICCRCCASAAARNNIAKATEAWNQRAESAANRVLTLEEAKAHCVRGVDAAPLWGQNRLAPSMSRWYEAAAQDTNIMIDALDRFLHLYGIRFRFWLRKPTEDEMAGTPWEGENDQ